MHQVELPSRQPVICRLAVEKKECEGQLRVTSHEWRERTAEQAVEAILLPIFRPVPFNFVLL